MNRYYSLIIFFLLSCSKSPENLIKLYEKAHNSHDIKRSMSLYHDSIKFELHGAWVKKGKNEIRALEEWDSALNSHLKFKSIRVKNDSVFCRVIEKNDWFKAIGINELIHDPVVFIVKDNCIYKIIARPRPETSLKVHKTIKKIAQWSTDIQDDTISELIKNGEFIYSKKAAKDWIELLKKWNKSKPDRTVNL